MSGETFSQGDIAHLARRIRGAINLESGVIDLGTCLEVARGLETMAAGGPGHPALVQANWLPVCEPVPTSRLELLRESDPERPAREIRRIFALPSIRDSHCLALFLANPDRLLTCDDIAMGIGCTPKAVRIHISHVRQKLNKLGMGNSIVNHHGRGYIMPLRAAELLNGITEGWLDSAILHK